MDWHKEEICSPWIPGASEVNFTVEQRESIELSADISVAHHDDYMHLNI